MKNICRLPGVLAFILLLAAAPARVCSAAEETLNNAAIVELQKMSLGDGVILEKIKTSKCNFDTSLSGLKQLKEANVSSAVIQAMVATKSSVSSAPAAATFANSNDPLAMHPGGVWVLQGKTMSRVEYLRPVMGTKGSGYNPWTGATFEQFVYLPGTKSKLQLSERRPTFYFYFVTEPVGLASLFTFNAIFARFVFEVVASDTRESHHTICEGVFFLYVDAPVGDASDNAFEYFTNSILKEFHLLVLN